VKETPWHAGEMKMHTSLGLTEKMESLGRRMIRDFMPDQHREFYSELEFVVLSALDKEGRIWPFIWTGAPGFISSPSPKDLVINLGPLVGQPEGLLLGKGNKISLLGITPETKRRNRLNGTIIESGANKIRVRTDQSYGNCPRYIHVRRKGETRKAGTVENRETLSVEDKTLIGLADTIFIGSRALNIGDDPRAGIDVNHRGGLPGFVTVRNDGSVIVPDYAGNNFFNTLGNISDDPRTGILIPNFETGDLLTLNGKAEVILNDDKGLPLYGSHRYLIFFPDKIRRANGAFPFYHDITEYSSNPPKHSD